MEAFCGITDQLTYVVDALISELKDDRRPNPDVTIMVPFVFSEVELDLCVKLINRVWKELSDTANLKMDEMPFKLGAVLEVPRAYLVAEKIAAVNDLSMVCFASSELTELVFGMNRSDSEGFMVVYVYELILLHCIIVLYMLLIGSILGQESTGK